MASTWTFPHDEYDVGRPDRPADLLDLEALVPGARTYATVETERGTTFDVLLSDLVERAEKGDQDARRDLDCTGGVVVRVPLHGSWLVADALEREGIRVLGYRSSFDSRRHRADMLVDLVWEDDSRLILNDAIFSPTTPAARLREPDLAPKVAAVGWLLARRLAEQGDLRPKTVAALTQHQLVGLAVLASRPSTLLVWPAGRGKTLGALAGAATRLGGVLVVTPNAVRGGWAEQVRQWTTWEPHEIIPAGDRRAGHEDLPACLARMDGRRPVVVANMESLALHLDELLGRGAWRARYRAAGARVMQPATFILDEIQKCSSPQWWDALPTQEGGVDFNLKRTPAANAENDRITRASAVYMLSSLPSLRLRIELSASPLHNGRPRRLYGPLTFLSDRSKGPGEWGKYRRHFAARHCVDPRKVNGDAEYFSDKNAENMDELAARCSFIMHEVTLAESSAGLPQTRFEVEWLEPGELAPATGELGRALKRLGKARKAKGEVVVELSSDFDVDPDALADVGELAQVGSLTWLRLAEASVRKTPRALAYVNEAFRSRQKIVLFTALRSDCERVATAVTKMLRREDKDSGSPVQAAFGRDAPVSDVFLRWGHGGTPTAEREETRKWFRDATGPCVLVGTGQAWGTGVDGFQSADLALILMLTWEVSDLVVQWRGRFDRYGPTARATLVKVLCARGTYDEALVNELVKQVGPIRELLEAVEFDGVEAKLRGQKFDAREVQRRVLLGLRESIFKEGGTLWAM